MNSLLKHYQQLRKLKSDIQTEGSLYKVTNIENYAITPECLSIVMTASDRSEQTYYTLDTIAASAYKNLQIIIVDDSASDPILYEKLIKYPLYITFIEINRQAKCWLNPLVNYNIGFKYIKGDKIIIQNAEVCHIGDIISDMLNRLQDNTYIVYDVRHVNGFSGNKLLYSSANDYNTVMGLNIYAMWYQARHFKRNLHFLVGLNLETFKRINCEFSYDCTYGFGYDDDDFLLKIVAAGINILTVHHDEGNHVFGIHQYHVSSPSSWGYEKESNETLFNIKKAYFNTTNQYMDLTMDLDNFDTNIGLLMYT